MYSNADRIAIRQATDDIVDKVNDICREGNVNHPPTLHIHARIVGPEPKVRATASLQIRLEAVAQIDPMVPVMQ